MDDNFYNEFSVGDIVKRIDGKPFNKLVKRQTGEYYSEKVISAKVVEIESGKTFPQAVNLEDIMILDESGVFYNTYGSEYLELIT
jgi:hypothetical protein